MPLKNRKNKRQQHPSDAELNLEMDMANIMLEAPSMPKGGSVSDLSRPMRSSGGCEGASFSSKFGLDPRTTLTLKAAKTKAIHSTKFLMDDVRRKRGLNKSLRIKTREDGKPCLLYHEASVLTTASPLTPGERPTCAFSTSCYILGASFMTTLNST